MSKRAGRSASFYVYVASAVLHSALALGAIVLPKRERTTTVAIELAEAKKKKDPPKPPAPPPPPPRPSEEKPKPRALPQPQAKVAPAPQPVEAEAPPSTETSDGFADLGVSMGNAQTGSSSGAPSAATGHATKAAPAPSASATTRRVRELAPTKIECSEPAARPKRKVPVAPKYTMAARQAEIEGVVRVEVTVDEQGKVIAARILNGLGYGLDESALEAARATLFEPAVRCGKPTIGTAILPFRFEQT